MSDPELIECPEHGVSRYTTICVHLRKGDGLEYLATPACPHGPALAWCVACDAVLARERGWNDAADAHADWALFCTQCYKETLRRHTFVEFVVGSDEPCDFSEAPSPDE